MPSIGPQSGVHALQLGAEGLHGAVDNRLHHPRHHRLHDEVALLGDDLLDRLADNVIDAIGEFMHGALPQLPPIVGLFNLNPVIVRENLKEYSKQDELQFDAIIQATLHQV